MRSILRSLCFAMLFMGSLFGVAKSAAAQGTIPIALVQQFGTNGVPLAGCLVYFYQAGTVATPQNSYQDFGLTIPNPNPLQCDQYGRVPMFWLANGLIHARLTDSGGTVYLDTTMQVLGPSGGSGGGSTIDPTTIAATGDVKFRPTSETLSGWVKMAGLSIGSATSGGTERANADTQNLFVYLWTNCHLCSVSGGKGTSALNDFNANKTISVPDWRGRTPVGLDNMDNTAAGVLLSQNVTSPGDGVTTPGATGGIANPTISTTNLPTITSTNSGITLSVSYPNFVSCLNGAGVCGTAVGGDVFETAGQANTNTQLPTSGSGTPFNVSISTQGTSTFTGSNAAIGTLPPMMLGTWYEKLAAPGSLHICDILTCKQHPANDNARFGVAI